MGQLKVLMPMDGSVSNQCSIDYLKNNYSKDEVSVTLFNTVEVFNWDTPFVPNLQPLRERNKKILDEAITQLSDYKVDTRVEIGSSVERIIQTAEDDEFNLIIIPEYEKTGPSKLVGSVADRVAKYTDIPVIAVPQ